MNLKHAKVHENGTNKILWTVNTLNNRGTEASCLEDQKTLNDA